MSATKKLTVSAILTALGSALMIVGAMIEVLDLTVCAAVSLFMVFIYLEIGPPYTYLVWICTSLCTALLYSASIIWVEYFLVFGIYPILKSFVERLPRPLWLLVKLLYINAIVLSLMFISERVLGIPFFEDGAMALKIITYVLISVAFVAYDMFITVMVKVYIARVRPKISKFLK